MAESLDNHGTHPDLQQQGGYQRLAKPGSYPAAQRRPEREE
jgi:hypothetical protein